MRGTGRHKRVGILLHSCPRSLFLRGTTYIFNPSSVLEQHKEDHTWPSSVSYHSSGDNLILLYFKSALIEWQGIIYALLFISEYWNLLQGLEQVLFLKFKATGNMRMSKCFFFFFILWQFHCDIMPQNCPISLTQSEL